MARISGVDIPRDKRVVISLTYIFGIGKPTAQKILKDLGISEDRRVKDLTEEELTAIRREVAALKVEGLKVIERHEHSRDVPYIKDGKDAAVSYNSADLKFKNNLDYDIKIEAKVEDRNVKIKLIRI